MGSVGYGLVVDRRPKIRHSEKESRMATTPFGNITKSHIERLCSYISDDRYIANYLGIKLDRVKNTRKTMPRKAIANRSHYDSVLVTDDKPIQFDKLKATYGKQCDDLLRRQLETGQCHWDRLTAKRVLCAKGWLT